MMEPKIIEDDRKLCISFDKDGAQKCHMIFLEWETLHPKSDQYAILKRGDRSRGGTHLFHAYLLKTLGSRFDFISKENGELEYRWSWIRENEKFWSWIQTRERAGINASHLIMLARSPTMSVSGVILCLSTTVNLILKDGNLCLYQAFESNCGPKRSIHIQLTMMPLRSIIIYLLHVLLFNFIRFELWLKSFSSS